VAARVIAVSKAKERLQEPQLDSTYYRGRLDVPFLSLPIMPRSPEAAGPTGLKVVVKVLNQGGAAIMGAKVAILPLQGAATVTVGATSNAGVFESAKPVRVGNYRLRVESAGFTKVEGQVELVESRTKGKASFTVRLKKL